jgi:protein-disulfide isomerase
MTNDKRSKRQERRDKVRQQETRSRWLTIGFITIGAVLLVFGIVWNQVKPIAALVSVKPASRPNTDRNSMGDPNAPIKIEEFSDFQCPYCERFYNDTEPLLVQYYISTGKVHFTYRSAGNWVSSNVGGGSTESQDAAMAAYCAADQNKFWEMHDSLFANNRDVEDQGSFTSRRLTEIAKSIGLDVKTYQDCYDSNKYKDQVQKDFDDAVAAKIQGTPYFVITYTVNGETKTKTLDGAQPFNAFQVELEADLHEAGAQ